MPSQVVRIVNNGDSDFIDAYGSQPYVIPAHTETVVEYDAMALWLGHPEATNFDPRNRVRVAEYARLRGRYGVDARALEMSTQGQAVNMDSLFNSMRPKLEVFDLSGKPVLTVADDPEGTFLTAAVESDMDSQTLIQARMFQMEQEMQNLRAQLAQQQRTEQALNDATPVPSDTFQGDPEDAPLQTGGSGITGTIAVSPTTDEHGDTIAPRPTARTEPGEDSPTRVRVSG